MASYSGETDPETSEDREMESYSGDLSEEEQATRAREERQQIVLRSRMIKNYDFQNLFMHQ